jgi:hypothetical protein
MLRGAAQDDAVAALVKEAMGEVLNRLASHPDR